MLVGYSHPFIIFCLFVYFHTNGPSQDVGTRFIFFLLFSLSPTIWFCLYSVNTMPPNSQICSFCTRFWISHKRPQLPSLYSGLPGWEAKQSKEEVRTFLGEWSNKEKLTGKVFALFSHSSFTRPKVQPL